MVGAGRSYERLKEDDIYAGTPTSAGNVSPGSPTPSPTRPAEWGWQMAQDRTAAEVQ